MYDILITGLLTCSEAKILIDRVSKNPTNEAYRSELIQTIKDSSEEYCTWDAKAD